MPRKPAAAQTKLQVEEEEVLFNEGDYLAIYDTDELDMFTVLRVSHDVASEEDDVQGIYYNRVKGNKFASDITGEADSAHVVMAIPQGQLTETMAPVKKTTKKVPAQKATFNTPREIIITQKYYNSLKAAAKKFVPPAPESDESESEEEEEEEEIAPKKVTAGSRKSSVKPNKSQPTKAKPAKAQPAKTAKVTKPTKKKASAMDEEDPEEDLEEVIERGELMMDEEDFEEKISKPSRKVKSNEKPAKVEKPKIGFKKGKYNSAVSLIPVCQQLESTSQVPNFECSTRNSNREVIRAAKIGSKKLLEKIVQSDGKISRLMERWGVDNRITALKILIDSGNKDLLITFLEYLQDEKKTIKWGTDNIISLQKIDTGYNDKYAYGVATRRVNVSRGGREGNNAFVEDRSNWVNVFDVEHIDYLLSSPKSSVETVKTVLNYVPNLENQLLSRIGSALRGGKPDIAAFLIEKAMKNGGYGLNEFYLPALVNKSATGALADIKKASVTKKAFGMGNFSPLHTACLNPNVAVLKHLLQVNPEYLNIDDSMRKPVHYAACCMSAEPMKYLLSQSVDAREGDNMKTTPLMYAARVGSKDVVRVLLADNKSVPAAKDRKGYAAIHYAAENGHRDVIQLLVDSGVKIAIPGPDRMTALHIASMKGDLETVRYLVEQGAKVLCKDKLKRSPLILAAKNGNLAVASYLLSQGSAFDEPDSSGNTALHYACAYGYIEMIDVLLKAGADPNSVNSWNLSPTAVALLKSYFSALRRMLDDPRTNVNCVDDQGRSLISNAIKTISAQNFSHVAFLLREKKADPNIADTLGLTPLDHLVEIPPEKLAEEEYKLEMSLAEREKILAEKRSLYRKYISLLLDSGADVNHKDNTGEVAVFAALDANNSDGSQLLLDAPSIDLGLLDKKNSSIFHYLNGMIFNKEFLPISKKIVQKCGQKVSELVNRYNNDGQTAIHHLFSKFSNSLDSEYSTILTRLKVEFQLSKKPKAGTEEDESNAQQSLAQNANFMGLGRHGKPMKMAKRAFAKQPDPLANVSLTSEELATIEAKAKKEFEAKVNAFLDFMRLIQSKGGDFNLLVKKPIITRDPNVESEEAPDPIYDIFGYFDFFFDRIKKAIEAKIDLPPQKIIPENVGYSLLHLACHTQNLAVYKYLIEEAKVKTNQSSVHGETELLHFVNQMGVSDESDKALEYLLSKQLNPNAVSLKKMSPLLLAVTLNKEKFVKTLIKFKADVNKQNSEGTHSLLQAVKNKTLGLVEFLLANGADPNLTDEKKRNSIHWAINLSNADADASNEIENCLLSSGGNVNAIDIRGRSPLHYAFVKMGAPFENSAIDPIETVSNIVSRPGVQVDVRDQWGNTPLNYASQRGAVVSALYLLKHGAALDNRNNDKNTPLDECLLQGHQNMSIFLIQKNADIKTDLQVVTLEQKEKKLKERQKEEKEKEEEKKKLRLAAFESKKMDEESIEEDGEDPQYDSDVSQIEDIEEDYSDSEGPGIKAANSLNNPTYNFGNQPRKIARAIPSSQFGFGFGTQKATTNSDLTVFGDKEKVCSTFSVAIRRNWQAVAFLMLEYGFDLSLAILDCFAHGKFNYVYTLLLKKADAGVYQMKNSKGQNLVHLFAENSSKITDDLYQKILGKIETKNLDFQAVDNLGRTALHYACKAGCLQLAKHLLVKGLDANKPDLEGSTPLGLFLRNNFGQIFEFASFAVGYRIELNKRFNFKKRQHTILTWMVSREKSLEAFGKLVALGADPNIGDGEGCTPLVYAVRNNNLETVQSLIRDFRADPRVIDNEGRTIIHWVVKPRNFGSYENVDMMEYLLPQADANRVDKLGKTPLDYARQQLSGRLAEVLVSHKAKETATSDGIKRVTTSILNDIEFPIKSFDYEGDFEKFLQACKQDAKDNKMKFEQRVPVDRNANGGNYEVVYDGDDAYDCFMVKVDIHYGTYSGNTFYKMQILRDKVREVFIVFTRWGRVGTDGQFQQTPFSKLEDARKEFTNIFKSKSGNLWEDRHKFQKVKGKYRLVPYVTPTKFENYIKAFNYSDPRIIKTQLDEPTYDLLRRICNYKVISSALKSKYQINQDVLPVQNLTKERILDAKAILDTLEKCLQEYEKARTSRNNDQIETSAEELSNLSSEFYELIPKTTSKDQAIPPITNVWTLSETKKMINDLLYFEVVIKMIGAATYNIKNLNPMDYCFNCLKSKLIRLDKQTDEFQILKEYVEAGRQQITEKNLICNIYAIERAGEREKLKAWDSQGNKILLWHGTKPENVMGILQTGFRVAPSDAAGTGAMFGSGIYFADIFAKSYNYTPGVTFRGFGYNPHEEEKALKEPKKYLVLCEVALGKMKKIYQAENVTDLPNSKFQSVMGVGQTGPDAKGNIYLPNGCVVPLGKLVQTPMPKGQANFSYFNLAHNEYIVYDTTQVRIKYLLELR